MTSHVLVVQMPMGEIAAFLEEGAEIPKLLHGGDDRKAFGGFAGGPLVPVEAVHLAAAGPVQQLAQMHAPAGLHRRLAENVRAALELAGPFSKAM